MFQPSVQYFSPVSIIMLGSKCTTLLVSLIVTICSGQPALDKVGEPLGMPGGMLEIWAVRPHTEEDVMVHADACIKTLNTNIE